jgi:hypothetical protein
VIQQPKDWQALRAQMRANALALVETNPSADQARVTISEVIKELASAAPDAGDADFYRVRVIALIAARLRDRGLTEWADALERRSNTGQGPEPSGYAIEMLIGTAAGLFCGTAPGERQFTFVRHLREVIPFESVDFVTAAETPLKLDGGAVRALAAMSEPRHSKPSPDA